MAFLTELKYLQECAKNDWKDPNTGKKFNQLLYSPKSTEKDGTYDT